MGVTSVAGFRSTRSNLIPYSFPKPQQLGSQLSLAYGTLAESEWESVKT